MSTYFMASLLAAQLAAAPAPQETALPSIAPIDAPGPGTASALGAQNDAAIAVSPDWAAPRYRPDAMRAVVHTILQEERAQVQAIPARLSAGPQRDTRYEHFAELFSHAQVPHCLGRNALKHQPPKIGPIAVGGILALPFLAVAAIRGKCK